MSLTSDRDILWSLAQSWVRSNRVLIWSIVAPYYRHMSCDSVDVTAEAQITAYQVISILINQNKDLSLTGRYFRIVFRTRCIQLAAGVQTSALDEQIIQKAPDQSDQKKNTDLDESVITEALSALTDRQRQLSLWVLSQPNPVSFKTIATHFGIHTQTVRDILTNTISRLEKYGHRRLRGDLTGTA